jgi:hypothetical protein
MAITIATFFTPLEPLEDPSPGYRKDKRKRPDDNIVPWTKKWNDA